MATAPWPLAPPRAADRAAERERAHLRDKRRLRAHIRRLQQQLAGVELELLDLTREAASPDVRARLAAGILASRWPQRWGTLPVGGGGIYGEAASGE